MLTLITLFCLNAALLLLWIFIIDDYRDFGLAWSTGGFVFVALPLTAAVGVIDWAVYTQVLGT